MYEKYIDKKIAFLFSIKNRNKLKIDTKEILNLLGNCLDTLCNALNNFTFNAVDFYFVDFNSNDCNFSEEIKAHIKKPYNYYIKYLPGMFGKGPGYNFLLDSINIQQYDCISFIDADMLFVRNLVLINAFKNTIEEKKAYFPVCRRLEQNGTTREPEFTGTGNCFIPTNIFIHNKLRFIDKFSWGGEDTAFFQNVQNYCEIVQETVPGFYHQWHPEKSFWETNTTEEIQ